MTKLQFLLNGYTVCDHSERRVERLQAAQMNHSPTKVYSLNLRGFLPYFVLLMGCFVGGGGGLYVIYHPLVVLRLVQWFDFFRASLAWSVVVRP